MSLMSRRKPDDEDVPPVPAFLHPEPIENSFARLPHPRASDPLNPSVAELMSKAILESGEAYVQSVINEVEKDYRAYEEYRAQVHAWAEGERARFTARAEDIAAAHKEMQDSREKFLALPRAAAAPDAEQKNDAAG